MHSKSQYTAVAAVLALSAGAAQAATVSALMAVSATVPSSCSVAAGNLAFGNVNPKVQTDVSTTLTVTCTANLPYSVTMDAGQHYDAARSLRSMVDANGGKLRYHILKNAEGSGQWGDNDFGRTYNTGSSLAFTGTGAAQNIPVYGRIAVSSNNDLVVAPGAYSDQVLVTINY